MAALGDEAPAGLSNRERIQAALQQKKEKVLRCRQSSPSSEGEDCLHLKEKTAARQPPKTAAPGDCPVPFSCFTGHIL